MAKELAAAVIVEIDATQKRPRMLMELQDARKQIILRFAASESNITFPNGVTTWTAKAFEVSEFDQSIEGQISRVTVNIDNIARDMAAYMNSYQFAGGIMRLIRVYLDSTTGLAPVAAANYNEIFYGTIEAPKNVTMEVMPLSATIGKPLTIKPLVHNYSKSCDYRFGDSKCNTDGNANLERFKGVADSGSNTTLVDSELIQADDYWNSGQILIIKGTNQYVATVTDFADGTVTFADIGVAVDSTCIYTIRVQGSNNLMVMGLADSGTTITLVDAALTEVDDYWNFGIIEIVKAGILYRRNVFDFDAATDTVTLDVALPLTVDNTCVYSLIKGCDKTWDTCGAVNAWGPFTDNQANFLGFVHIGVPIAGGKPGVKLPNIGGSDNTGSGGWGGGNWNTP